MKRNLVIQESCKKSLALGVLTSLVLLTAIVPCKGMAISSQMRASLRTGQSLTLLPNGQILLAGGYDNSQNPVSDLAIADASGNVKSLSIKMQHSRSGHTATVLPDGRVLIFGGYGANGQLVSAAETFDPNTGTIGALSGFSVLPRAFHTSTVLTDGTLLVAGGVGTGGQVEDDVQVWDYRTGTVLAYHASLSVPRQRHAATLVSNGNVQVSGGLNGEGQRVTVVEEYDVSAHQFRVVSQDAVPDSPAMADSLPQDGAANITITTSIGVRFNEEMSVLTVNTNSVSLQDSAGNSVQATVTPAEAGRLIFVIPTSPLQFGTTYFLTLDGLADNNNRALPTASIRFTTVQDPQDSSDEEWVPGPDDFNGQWHSHTGLSQWQKLPPLQAKPGVTALSGQVLRLNGLPLSHALLQIDGIKVYSDRTGRFLIQNIHGGHHVLIIDGRAANRAGATYGLFEVGADISVGITNVLNYTIWMTKLDMAHAVSIPSPTVAEDTVITTPRLPGLELHLPKNTVIVDFEGHPVRQITITAVPLDKPPFPLPPGVQVPIYFTIQPGGAYIDVRNWSVAGSSPQGPKDGAKGARLIYPNPYHNQPGAVFDFWNYDADSKGWYVYGHGQVNKTGTDVEPDPGVVVYEFTGAMVGVAGGKFPHCPVAIPTSINSSTHLCLKDGDPVDLATGLFVYNKTDLVLPDVIPLELTRTYRTNDNVSRSFGIGTANNYDLYMTGVTNPYTYQELILPDGYAVRFNRISPGTSYTDAVYTHTSAPDEFYGATLTWDTNNTYGASWVLRMKDGTQYFFPDSAGQPDPMRATAIGIVDRHGNSFNIKRNPNGDLLQITSPNGRYLQFTYDASRRITQAADNLGRTVHYTYDSSGRLYTVQDAAGGTTTFLYNSLNQMTSIQDARLITYLQNTYDSGGRVLTQTLANQGTYHFGWTLTQNTSETFSTAGYTGDYTDTGVLNFRGCSTCSEGYSPLISQVDVTDPRGYIHRVTFDSMGREATEIFALNQPEQETYTYSWNADNTLKSATNALGHQTSYTYDARMNLTESDRLAETSSPVKTTFSYEPQYNQLTGIVDPLLHSTNFSVDSYGNTTQVTDALGNGPSFTYNADGTPATTTLAGNTYHFSYSGGDLVSILDPANNQTNRFLDSAGRLLAVTDPVGHKIQYQYNNLNQVTQIIDPVGNATTLMYDPNGNLQSVTDALHHMTSYTYDNMEQLWTRTDPLLRQETYLYDSGGNLVSFTDRKGQVTTYTYDGLNRPTFIGFGTQVNSGVTTYASTISYQYDAGNRMTQAVDSIFGTETRMFDGLDRLTSETTPLGSISYGYDAASRRSTMQIVGQSQVQYTYDNANRLTQIAQGSTTVGFSFDTANRRSTLTLPNGIVANYSYDQDSRVTGISYSLGSNVLGGLGYNYDSLGRMGILSGAMAATGLPAAVNSASYDAANELTSWNGTTITYDSDGNMQSDGMHSYTWDARNQLSMIDSGSTATFGYDSFGRRTSKSVLGSATNFFYDGDNPVQELSGTTPSANLLTGGFDEYFSRNDSNGARSFLADGIGSTLTLADSSGVFQTQYGYDPYGSTTQAGTATTNSFAYTSRENDSTSLYFLRARYYNPAIGRFLSEDPIGFGGGLNLYVYANNNPVLYSDPSGLAYTLSRGSGQTVVNAAIVLYGPGASAALASRWQQAISKAWNNNPGQGNCIVSFRVEVTADPKANHWWTTTDNPNFSGYAQNYIYVPQGDVETYVDGNTFTGQWWRYASLDDIAHEAGHLFRLPDFYNPYTLKPLPGFEGDIMANEAGGGRVTQRDINGILHGRAPCGCGK